MNKIFSEGAIFFRGHTKRSDEHCQQIPHVLLCLSNFQPVNTHIYIYIYIYHSFLTPVYLAVSLTRVWSV